MSDFIKVADTSDIPMGRALVVVVGDRRIALCNVDGQFYALEEEDQWVTLLFLDAGQLEVVQREGLLAVVPGEESRAVEFGQAIEGEAEEHLIDRYGGD